MKKGVILVLFLFSFISFASATDCYMSSDCGTDNEILYASSTTNAHVSITSQTGYLKVCCPDLADTVTSSAIDSGSCTGSSPFQMSSSTNAHIEETGDYPKELCLSDANIQCNYETLNPYTCDEGYFCLLKYNEMSGFTGTNAHVADCSDTFYNKKVCCSIGSCINVNNPCEQQSDCCQPPTVVDPLYCTTSLTNPNEKGCCGGGFTWQETPGGWICLETSGETCEPDWTPENQGSYLEETRQACCGETWRQIVDL